MTADLVLDIKNETGEGPVWDPVAQALWWTDIPAATLHRLLPGSGKHDTFAAPGRVGSFALHRDGGLLLAIEHAFGKFEPATGRYTELAAPELGMTGNRFNDGRCDRRGRFYAGSMYEPRGREGGALWRYDGGAICTRVADGVTVANGLAWSPDD